MTHTKLLIHGIFNLTNHYKRMKELKELREILCTVPEIKENISEKWGTVKVTDTYELLKEETPIQERHIRMYCNNKNIQLIIQDNGVVKTIDESFIISKVYNIITNLDNTKDLENQDPKVIQKIVDFLKQ